MLDIILVFAIIFFLSLKSSLKIALIQYFSQGKKMFFMNIPINFVVGYYFLHPVMD